MTPAQAADTVRRGNALFAAGKTADAEALADRVIAAHPKEAGAHYLKGLCLRAAGEVEAALSCLARVERLRPGSAETANVAALCHKDLGDHANALHWFETACARAPMKADPHVNRAQLLFDERRFHDAAEAFRSALRAGPGHRLALQGLANTLDALNDADAESVADRLLAVAPGDAVGLAVKAGALSRRQEFEAAVTLIDSAGIAPGEHPESLAMAMGRRGEALERLRRYEDAFESFRAGNEAVRAAMEPVYRGKVSPFAPETAERLEDFYQAADWPDPAPAREASPVFLIGFPRSGTTLLETVLASHSAIRTSEEAPHAGTVIEDAGLDRAGFEAFLAARPYEQAKRRKLYWRSVEGGAPEAGGIFIDKLPLNLAWAGMLGHAFPDAKFILALRDPRDCVLSAFKQRFAMNAAMFQMLRLDTAARYYDRVMRAGLAGLDCLGEGRVIEVRYEHTVADLDGEADRVLAFLGLDREEGMRDYRQRALDRGIVTPSAPQVVEPVYTRSAGLWRNYAFALEPVRPILDPWAERWGYES